MQFNKRNRKFQSNVKETKFTLPINIFTFKPCKEYIILKIKLMGKLEELSEITDNLSKKGVPIDNVGVLNKIVSLSKKHTQSKVIQIVYRWYKRNERKG